MEKKGFRPQSLRQLRSILMHQHTLLCILYFVHQKADYSIHATHSVLLGIYFIFTDISKTVDDFPLACFSWLRSLHLRGFNVPLCHCNGLEFDLSIAIMALMKTKRLMTELLKKLCRPQIIPDEPAKACSMCLEPGAKTRPCCNSNFCNFW